MFFTGREKETAQVQRALERGNNVVVVGKYGIGRTSLVRHVAGINRDRWRFVFVDFSQTPAKICGHLLDELFPKRGYRRGGVYVRYRSGRFKISSLDLEDRRQHVIVLDNVARLSKPKLDFVGYLAWEKRFRFVAIVEAFAPKDDLLLLRAVLRPAVTISLRYLTAQHAREFFRHFSERHGLGWTETRINYLAGTTGGYPLGMKEAVAMELERRWRG